MNPSVGQILEAITAANAEHVIVLPNNPNVRLAAENAASESTKDVRVVPTASVPEGVAAAFAFDAGADVDANEAAIHGGARAGRGGGGHGRVARRDGRRPRRDRGAVPRDRRRARLRDGGRPVDGARRPPRALRGRGLSLVNAYRGEDAPDEGKVAARIEQHGLEAAVLWGGQPHYPLLLSAEWRRRRRWCGSCSSRTTTCTARRSSCSSASRRGSRSSVRSARERGGGRRDAAPRRRRADGLPAPGPRRGICDARR